MAETLGVFDAKSRFSELIDRAERGEEIIVTRHGKPVARVAPLVPASRTSAEFQDLMATASELRERIRRETGTVSREEIIAWKNEGRR